MRCKSGSANKFKLHVSCVLPPSHPRISLQFKLHQERITVCNPQPENVLWEIILGVLEMPRTPQKSRWAAARTIQLAQKLETNSKTYKDRMLTIVGQMKGIWATYGEIRENMKGSENHYRKEPGWILFCGISQGDKLFWGYWMEMPCTSQKTAARTTQLAQRLGKT